MERRGRSGRWRFSVSIAMEVPRREGVREEEEGPIGPDLERL